MAETPDGQIILEEEVDENYEPTEAEILEYASWLGMELPKEKVRLRECVILMLRHQTLTVRFIRFARTQELLWIAKEGLKAPLPKDWKPCKTPTGDIYYFNFT